MKHLKPFNEAVKVDGYIQDIINIAIDEGCHTLVRTLGDRYNVFIYNYPITQHGIKYGEPIMDNMRFIEMVRGIYERLDNEGCIIVNPFHEHKDDNIFRTGVNVSGWTKEYNLYDTPITSTIRDSHEAVLAKLVVYNR